MGKVLVVDDHPNIVRLVERALQSEHEVRCAYDGEEALEKVAEELPDLVILDVVMPRLDGFRVLNRLKTTPETRDITVMMFTSRDQPEEVALGLDVGADYYIPKPFNAGDLAALVRRIMDGKKQAG